VAEPEQQIAEDAEPSLLDHARQLVAALEADNAEEADEILAKLASLKESNLFIELGKLTREFHEALKGFRHDERIATLAEDDIPDAKERLRYVIEKTDDAAHRTLNAVESSLPLLESLSDKSTQLNDSWQRFTKRELTPAEFRELTTNLGGFLQNACEDTGTIKSHLNDVLMAQDYQDITGQIIRRVITLVEEVEGSLVHLVKLGSGLMEAGGVKKDEEGLAGPQVPGLESEDIVASQDDVDDLLSSLGF
jgi:chemotaxis protein CheZ